MLTEAGCYKGLPKEGREDEGTCIAQRFTQHTNSAEAAMHLITPCPVISGRSGARPADSADTIVKVAAECKQYAPITMNIYVCWEAKVTADIALTSQAEEVAVYKLHITAAHFQVLQGNVQRNGLKCADPTPL